MQVTDRLDWDRDGADWPARETSCFVETDDGRWHVQVSGQGPVVLLLHGTGASSHSWRDISPRLAQRFTVVVPDLPGHAFTRVHSPHLLSLPGMSAALARLMSALRLEPSWVIGHSAGAAVAVRACLDGAFAPSLVVSLCGAMLPLQGLAGWLMPPAARWLAASGLASFLVARPARAPGSVERLLEGTGSRLDPRGVDLYRRLASSPGHVQGVVEMMARWNLESIARDLPHLSPPLLMLVAEADRTVPASEARRVRSLLPATQVRQLEGMGHLAHEEQPGQVAQRLIDAVAEIRLT